MAVEQITVEEFHVRAKAQGVSAREHIAFVCVVCGTVQSMASLIKAGAAPERVELLVGFSCEGRLRNAGPWLGDSDKSHKAKSRRKVRGCDWTLGGLFTIHQLEVVDDKGPHPRFKFATPEQAHALESAIREEANDG
jgi:hypothetical protein